MKAMLDHNSNQDKVQTTISGLHRFLRVPSIAATVGAVCCQTLFMVSAAQADTISPTSYSATIGVGETTTINKTVTVTPTSSIQADIFFLADTTGSMGTAINNVKAGASSIFAATSGLGNVQWGVGEYKDTTDAYAYKLNQPITSNTTLVQNGINAWSASGGGDWPEANLYALNQVATDAATGWRTGSRKLAVWFGDAPGHDPSVGVTEAAATAALLAEGISVLAVNVNSYLSYGLDSTGQASRIAAATGGSFYNGVSASLTADILDAISAAIVNYTSVCLDTSEAPAGVSVVSSACITGAFDRSISRDFGFTLSFTGAAPGIYDFSTYGTVDGGRVATERDTITVTSGGTVPEPATLLLMAAGAFGLFRIRRNA